MSVPVAPKPHRIRTAAWLCLAVAVGATALSARRLRGALAVVHGELRSLQNQLAQAADDLDRQATIPSGSGTAIPSQDGPQAATPGGLPVRPPGRTMAAADRGRTGPAAPDEGHDSPGRDAGAQFGAFHRSLKAPADPSATPAEQ
jgi:hypothetical protein